MVRINETASEVRETVGRAPTGWGWSGLIAEWGTARWAKTLVGDGLFSDANSEHLCFCRGRGADGLHSSAVSYLARLLLRCLFHPMAFVALSFVLSFSQALLVRDLQRIDKRRLKVLRQRLLLAVLSTCGWFARLASKLLRRSTPNRLDSVAEPNCSIPQHSLSALNSGVYATTYASQCYDTCHRVEPPRTTTSSSSLLFDDRCIPPSLQDILPSSLSGSHHSNQQQTCPPTTLPPPSYASQPQSPQAPTSQFAQGQLARLVEASDSPYASRSSKLLYASRPPLSYTPLCALLPRDSGLPRMTGLRRSRISDRLCSPGRL